MKNYKVVYIDSRFDTKKEVIIPAFDRDHAKYIVRTYCWLKEFISVEEV